MKKRYHKTADFFNIENLKSKNSLTGVAYVKKQYSTDILYVTTEGVEISNKTKIVTTDLELYDDRTLKEFTLQYDFFQRIGKTLVVNVKMIEKLSVKLNYIWLVNGIKLHVTSRNYKNELMQKLEQYL